MRLIPSSRSDLQPTKRHAKKSFDWLPDFGGNNTHIDGIVRETRLNKKAAR
jgi:hypothetical protein